jgi:hypothetical protein
LYTGQSQNKWKEKGCRQVLMHFLYEETGLDAENLLELTRKLSSEMAKVAQQNPAEA